MKKNVIIYQPEDLDLSPWSVLKTSLENVKELLISDITRKREVLTYADNV